jgi:hypothetical protein
VFSGKIEIGRLLNEAPHTVSPTLDLDVGWMRVVSFTLRPLYPREKSVWYEFTRRLVAFESRSGCSGEDKSSASAGNRILVVRLVTSHYTDLAIPADCLR